MKLCDKKNMNLSLWCFHTVLVCLAFLITSHSAYEERNILSKKFLNPKHHLTNEDLRQVQARLFKRTWNNIKRLPDNDKQMLLQLAEKQLKEHRWEWPTATVWMSLFTQKDRNTFIHMRNKYLGRLSTLVIGHLLRKEANPKDKYFLDEIVDGVWNLLQETTWIRPSFLKWERNNKELKYDFLPDPLVKAIDMASSDNAKIMAWLKLMLFDDFEKISPALNRRIDYELYHKIYYPLLNYPQFWSQGDVTNHNSWINSNIFSTAVVNLKNSSLFNPIVKEVIVSIDKLLNKIGYDGALNEGPAYWRQSAGRVIEMMMLMVDLYPDAKDYFRGVQLIKDSGEYVFKMHIDQNWFVNFGDSHPKLTYPPVLLLQFGELYQDEQMKNFALYMYKTTERFQKACRDLVGFFNFIQYKPYFDQHQPKKLDQATYYSLPSIQVITSRSNQSKSLFIGAKFATNNLNHNHNDVGNFILFQNGQPMFIDIGVAEYNATTFDPNLRYTYMYFRSGYHNVPSINGVEQFRDESANATDVSLQHKSDSSIRFSGNIAKTYPPEAQVKKWFRTMIFDQTENTFELNDQYELKKFIAPHQLNFVTHARARIEPTNRGLLLHSDNNETILMEFDRNMFDIKQDRWDIWKPDEELIRDWGPYIQRIQLVTRKDNRSLSGNLNIRFIPQ